ncbi:MAG: hypothetical protein HY758_09175, partial [Nitrospirae bacterium]|nr:hypothetical protein [Nitrospirota bacterium]
MVKTGFIDWTDEKLYIYIFEKKANQYSLIDSISAPVSGALNHSALQFIVEAGIDEFHVSVPADLLSIRALRFPFSDRHKIKATIAYELEGLLLGSTDNYAIDYFITGTSGEGSEVLAACLEKTRLREVISLFSSVGLEPKGVTSLDLKLNNKNIGLLYDDGIPDERLRAEAAKDELLNPTINLRQNELAYTGDVERINRSLRLTGILVLLLIFLLGSFALIKLMALKKENIRLTNEINAIYRSAFPNDTRIVDPVRQFKGNMNSLREKKAVLTGTP